MNDGVKETQPSHYDLLLLGVEKALENPTGKSLNQAEEYLRAAASIAQFQGSLSGDKEERNRIAELALKLIHARPQAARADLARKQAALEVQMKNIIPDLPYSEPDAP
ncbi:MAG: hypothetical protein LRZ85_01265 [Alphaproteobacteria bacterium]|nr:hypothetical protein [Alphaproteobacteria bacterium]